MEQNFLGKIIAPLFPFTMGLNGNSQSLARVGCAWGLLISSQSPLGKGVSQLEPATDNNYLKYETAGFLSVSNVSFKFPLSGVADNQVSIHLTYNQVSKYQHVVSSLSPEFV